MDLGASEAWNDNVELKKTLGKDILQNFHGVGKEHNLEDFEIPKAIVLEFSSWTPENGLLTGLGKVARKKVMDRYHLSIDLEYNRLQEEAMSHD